MKQLKSLKELKQLGLCLSKQEQLHIIGGGEEDQSNELSPDSTQSYYKNTTDTQGASDRFRCARTDDFSGFPNGLDFNCVRV